MQSTEKFIREEFVDKGYTTIHKHIKYKEDPLIIELAFLTHKIDSVSIVGLNQKLESYGLRNTRLEIKQTTADMKLELLRELGVNKQVLTQKDIIINQLQTELKKYKLDDPSIVAEMNVLFPQVKHVSAAWHFFQENAHAEKGVLVVLYSLQPKSKVDTTKMKQWLELKLNTNNLLLVPIND